MADISSDTENSQNDSDFNYISDYEIEDEQEVQEQIQITSNGNTQAKAVGGAEAATEGEESDEYELYAYADEPLADDEWIRKYNKQLRDQQRQQEELKRRLDGTEPLHCCNRGTSVGIVLSSISKMFTNAIAARK